MAEFAHHVAWLRPIEDQLNRASPTEGQRARFRLICEQVLSQNPESTLAATVLARLDSMATGTRLPLKALMGDDREKIEREEHRRIHDAVEAMIAIKAVTEDLYEAETETSRHAYVLSGPHYEVGQYNPAKTSNYVKRSQAQLFQFTHALETRGASSPIFVEGLRNGLQPFRFGGQWPMMHTPSGTAALDSKKGQSIFADNPGYIMNFFDQYQRLSRKEYGGNLPIFYIFSTYGHFHGAHTQKSEEVLDHMFERWIPWYQSFEKRYRELIQMGGTGGNVTIDTGYDERNRRHTMTVCGRTIPAADVERDMLEYFEYADCLTKANDVRDGEMSEFMRATPRGKIPLCYAGMGHEAAMIQALRKDMHVHVVSPVASQPYRRQRLHLPPNHPDGILQLKNFRKIFDAARSVLSRPHPR